MHIKSIAEVESTNLPSFIKDQLRAAFNEKNGNHITNTASNMERSTGNESIPAYTGKKFDTPVRIDIYSTRIQKTDIDNVSGKAALDGIINSGILKTDSPDQVERYQVHKPEIRNEEETIIVIEEI